MTASSVTGVGSGSVESVSTQSLNKTNIIFSGRAQTNDGPPISPSGYLGTCVFPVPLTGSPDSYVVVITSVNGGNVVISTLNEDENTFIGFNFVAEFQCEIMYIVTNNNV